MTSALDPVLRRQLENAVREARRVGEEVEAGKVLVLAPNRVFANPIRDALRDAGIAAESLFREKELDGSRGENGNPRAEEAPTLLALAADPEDLVALRCWCGLSAATSFGCAAWRRVREHSDSTGSALVEVLADVREGRVTWPQSWRLRNRTVRSVGTSPFLRELGPDAPKPIAGEALLREWLGCRSEGAA